MQEPTPHIPAPNLLDKSTEEFRRMEANLENYLDHACSPLLDVMPYTERQELRAEWRGHLESLIAAYQELGSDCDTATYEALRQFGNPRRLGRSIARARLRAQKAQTPESPLRSAIVASGGFLLSCLWMSAFIMYRRALYDDVPGNWGDLFNWGDLLNPMFAVVPPLLTGLFAGLCGKRPVLGTFHAFSFCMALTYLSAFVLPGSVSEAAWDFVIVQFYYWLPYSLLGACCGGLLQRLQANLGLGVWRPTVK